MKTTCPIQIRMADLDPFNHVNNGSQCHFYDYGRTLFYEQCFGEQIDWLTFEYVLAHLQLDFKRPILIHDAIVCETSLEELGYTSMKLIQRLIDTNTNEVKGICRSVVVRIDRITYKPIAIPEEHRKLLLDENPNK